VTLIVTNIAIKDHSYSHLIFWLAASHIDENTSQVIFLAVFYNIPYYYNTLFDE